MRARKATLVTLMLLCGPAGCRSKESTSWEPAQCAFTAPTLQASGGEAANWTSCRALYARENATAASVLTIQLLAPGTSGSVASPGPGWLTITVVDVDNTTGTRSVVPSIGSLTTPSVTIGYVTRAGRYVQFTRGSLTLRANEIAAYGDPATDSLRFSAAITASSADGATQLSGDFSVSSVAATAGTNPGGTGTTCNASTCSGYQRQCNGTAVQAPCYCAAACLCHCAGQASCEQANRASARALGTNCAY